MNIKKMNVKNRCENMNIKGGYKKDECKKWM
jgi:hypothetical protein